MSVLAYAGSRMVLQGFGSTSVRYLRTFHYSIDHLQNQLNTATGLNTASKPAQMSESNGVTKAIAPSIDVKSLSYAFPDGSSGLRNVILNLPPGSRTLLIGGKKSPKLSCYHIY